MYRLTTVIMADLNYVSNCTLDFNWTEELQNLTKNESVGKEFSTFELGTLLGTMVAMLIDVLSYEYRHYRKTAAKTTLIDSANSKTITRIIALAILFLCLPLIATFLTIAFVYKIVCCTLIKRRDSHFVEFLDSFDVFWSLEDDATQSIINVLGVIQSSSPYELAENIKRKLKEIITNNDTRKIFFIRNEKYGFYYWSRHNNIDMNEYVEIVELSEKESLNETDLQNLMTEVQNQALPYKNKGLFKILITSQRITSKSKNSDENQRDEFGIIFRIHHSVGDGVALIELLCKTLAEKSCSQPGNAFSFPDQSKVDSPSNILEMMQKLCNMPVCFIDGILREPDENSLHKPSLSGNKVFKWTESDEDLFSMVKEIKEKEDNLNFSTILVAALSKSLRKFFLKTMGPIPEEVAVVLPVRFPKSPQKNLNENNNLLKNDFSVTILDLPINENDVDKVKNRCDALRKSADPLTNYYFLKLVSGVLPKQVLEPMLMSSQATMIFSNLPGPGTLTICGGNILKSLVFFVPNKGTTGLGITALCYGGVLRFAAMADKALVADPEDLGLILEGVVDEIRQLHRYFLR